MFPERILVVRNDKLGDFMLAYPSFAVLKQSLPEAQICALVPRYTQEMAEACAWIDKVIVDPKMPGLRGVRELAALLREQRFDAVLTLFSTTRVGAACALARIPYRLAPATKAAQLFYTHRHVQRRSRSEKPEWAYNLDLVHRFLQDQARNPSPLPPPPFLQFDLLPGERDEFCREHHLDAAKRLVFLHPGSGGSANNLSLEQYAALARSLRSSHGHVIVVTAGPGEEEAARHLTTLLGETPHLLLPSRGGLLRFARTLQLADLFISGSTGPLHIAGALDRPTVAFYPRRRSATSLRWQTLNSPQHRLAFTPPTGAGQEEMATIDVQAAASAISNQFLI